MYLLCRHRLGVRTVAYLTSTPGRSMVEKTMNLGTPAVAAQHDRFICYVELGHWMIIIEHNN